MARETRATQSNPFALWGSRPGYRVDGEAWESARQPGLRMATIWFAVGIRPVSWAEYTTVPSTITSNWPVLPNLILGVKPRLFANSFWRLTAPLRLPLQKKQRLISIFIAAIPSSASNPNCCPAYFTGL
jgi:hypothetical protein